MHMLLQSLGLAVLRIGLGVMMLVHGWAKLSNYTTLRTQFADPFGLGMDISLMLAIFAEVACSILLILGVATRLATIPLIVTMLVAIFHAHGQDSWKAKELAAMYLLGYSTILLAGGGALSLDGLIFGWWKKRRAKQSFNRKVQTEAAKMLAAPEPAPPKR